MKNEAEQQAVEAASKQSEAVSEWPGKPGEHRWIARGLDPYHAVNLREALKLVPDTGDWHGSLRAACHTALQGHDDQRPNQTAEEMRARVSEDEVERAARVMYERDTWLMKKCMADEDVPEFDNLAYVEKRAWLTKARYVLAAARQAG